MTNIIKRIKRACKGYPNAEIPWPHRLLHDVKNEIKRLQPYFEAIDDGAVVTCTLNNKLSPSEQLQAIIDWQIRVVTDPAVNGGYKLTEVERFIDAGSFGRICKNCGHVKEPIFPENPEGIDADDLFEEQRQKEIDDENV